MAEERSNIIREAWYDVYKLFTYAFTKGPLDRKKDTRDFPSAGVTQPDAVPDIRGQDAAYGGSSTGQIRINSNEFVDLTTTSNRVSRYKEYDRLRNVAEIESAMTIFADEACVSGDTQIATVFHGYQTIEWLTKHKLDERFPVYCYDFEKGDYTIGWAFAPRKVKTAPTVRVILDDGSEIIATDDHRVLLRNSQWKSAGCLATGDELMPFYKIKANHRYNKHRHNQYPRIRTFNKGWVHERQFIDEWRLGKKLPQYEKVNQACRLIAHNVTARQIPKLMKHDWKTIESWVHREGFTLKEIRHLAKNTDARRVISVEPYKEMDVYDLSVEKHQNFCTNSCVLHNCQKDEDGNTFKIEVGDTEVRDELEFLFFHRQMLNMNKRIWNIAKNLFIKGDHFFELVINPDNPKEGVYKAQSLPPESMYRIESTRARLIEFQQSNEGPDYQALQKAPITTASDSELQQANAIRFAPEQVVHIRIGDDRKTFYPYGISLIEPARGPAHQLRMMEDAMVVYRLTRAPERRVFYIDVGQLPPFKAEAFMERMKDQFRKKKLVTNRGGSGANQVEERWYAPPQDEDYWLPIRPQSNTRIETLPGAQNLGEIDDAVYFRNKLFTALNFPKNYFSNEDPNVTRITLSAQDVKFARMIERLQSHIEDGLWEIADRHLQLRGFPPEAYEDLKIKMTPPSDWRELSRAEVVTNRINNANGLKGSQLLPDYDILTKWMKYDEDEANEMISRMKIQKLEDLKLQVLAQNPGLLGVGVPGQGEQEIGSEPGGPNPMLGPGGPGGGMPPGLGGPPPGVGMPPPGPPGGGPSPGAAPPGGPPMPPPPNAGGMMPPAQQASPIPEPSDDDIIMYDLQLQDYDADQDAEDIDFSEVE